MAGIVRLHHVGVAVRDLEKAREILQLLLGSKFSEPEYVESQKVKVAFSDKECGSLELIQATEEQSPMFPILKHPILSFIDKKGEGLHHLCFAVKGLEEMLKRLEQKGIRSLKDEILRGSGGGSVAFLDPNDCNGVLIELREEPDE